LTDVSEERIASIFRVAKFASETLALGGDYPEDGVLRNVGQQKTYTAPHARR
jgi:hypothetical protein